MKKTIISILVLLLSGCATLRVDKSYTFPESAIKDFRSELIIDQTTVHDVRRLFGDPHVVSLNEFSSVEIPKFALLEKFDYMPKETWTYFRPSTDSTVEGEDILKVLGVGLVAKDFQMVSIFFNEKGKVLGYVVNRHSIK